ncbi:hypothetical protein H5410_022800 [Solanum commersonii]|uniref:Uncharacterized protein n=1 Tax=Solanum commersonii TaxID=4109 RepID=A0A9J5ZHU1_SOLCO|nr:hypothetical protein H5410_022800 [Solanum commersonii]
MINFCRIVLFYQPNTTLTVCSVPGAPPVSPPYVENSASVSVNPGIRWPMSTVLSVICLGFHG